MSIKSLFEDIATAIKEMNTTITTVAPAQMPQAIRDIESGIPLYTSSEWNNLTTEEKQALSLTAIQQTETGYNRGILVNGADYVPTSNYIPHSDIDNIICESYLDNFDASSLTWGSGTNPINLSTTTALYDDNESIYIPALSSGIKAKIDLGATDLNYTAYFVGKLVNGGEYRSMFGSAMGGVNRTGVSLWSYRGYSGLYISAWGSDVKIVDIDLYTYFIAAIKYDSSLSQHAVGYSGSNIVYASSNSNNRYIGLGRYSDTDQQICDIAVKYIGVVNEAESDETIQQNLNYLSTIFS